MSSLYSRNSIW